MTYFAGLKWQKFTFLFIQQLCDSAVVLAELSQQPRGDGEQVTACQSFDFSRVPKGGAHNHCAVAILLVVVVDLGHTDHTWGGHTRSRWEIRGQTKMQ